MVNGDGDYFKVTYLSGQTSINSTTMAFIINWNVSSYQLTSDHSQGHKEVTNWGRNSTQLFTIKSTVSKGGFLWKTSSNGPCLLKTPLLKGVRKGMDFGHLVIGLESINVTLMYVEAGGGRRRGVFGLGHFFAHFKPNWTLKQMKENLIQFEGARASV